MDKLKAAIERLRDARRSALVAAATLEAAQNVALEARENLAIAEDVVRRELHALVEVDFGSLEGISVSVRAS